MLLSIISAVAMGGMALTMLVRAHQAKTCRMAILPLAAACLECLTIGCLTPSAFPFMTLLLVVLRATLFGCCFVALHRDLAKAKSKARRQKLARRLEARTVEPMLPGLRVLDHPYKVA